MIFLRRNLLAPITLLCAILALTSSARAQPTSGETATSPPGTSKTDKKRKTGRNAAPSLPTLPLHARAFLVVRGLEVWRGNFEFTNVGVNIPDLFDRFLNNNDSGGISAMQHAAKAGVRFVRCDGCTRSPEEFHRFLADSVGWLAAFQRMLAAADDLGIVIVPVLLPDIHMISAYVTSHSKVQQDSTIGAYLSEDTAPNRLALQYVDAVVGRFKNDPRVLFWEVGEEYNLEADLPASRGTRSETECYSSDQVSSFLIQIAARIKAIDRNHLVSSGNGDMRPNAWHLRQAMLAHRTAGAHKWEFTLDDSTDMFAQYAEMITFFSPHGIDFVSVHEAPPGNSQVSWIIEDDDHALRLPWAQLAASLVPAETAGTPAGKPIFVGEFGQPFQANNKALPILWTVDFLRRIRMGPSTLCALSAWETGESDPRSASLVRTPDLVSQISAVNLALLTASLAAPFNK